MRHTLLPKATEYPQSLHKGSGRWFPKEGKARWVFNRDCLFVPAPPRAASFGNGCSSSGCPQLPLFQGSSHELLLSSTSWGSSKKYFARCAVCTIRVLALLKQQRYTPLQCNFCLLIYPIFPKCTMERGICRVCCFLRERRRKDHLSYHSQLHPQLIPSSSSSGGATEGSFPKIYLFPSVDSGDSPLLNSLLLFHCR